MGVYTAPVLVTLIAPRMLNETIEHRAVAALVLVMAGSLLMFQPSGAFRLVDVALIVGSAALFAIFIVTTKAAVTVYQPLTVALAQLVVVSLLSLIFALGWETLPKLGSVVPILVLGLLHTAIAQSLYSWCLISVSATTSAILLCLEPVSALVLGWVLLAEHPEDVVVLGAGLVVGASLLMLRPSAP